MKHLRETVVVTLLLLTGLIYLRANAPVSQAAPIISNITVVVACNTSALISFRTSNPSHAFIQYGTTTGYGSTTINDSVRYYTEHAIQITGLSANTTYHFRINATDSTLTQSADQTFTTASSGATCPALPSQVDSRMPDMSGAIEYKVKASCTGVSNCFTNFQTALNTAGTDNGKRYITVDAGLTLSGQWTMPANSDGNWIIVRSSGYANLPEGKRVVPSDAANLFRLRNTNVDPTLVTAPAANHIRIIGAEITIDATALADAPGGLAQTGLINYGWNVAGSSANLAKFIGIDRCYVHGLPNKNTMRGAQVLGEDLFIVDSYFDDFHHNGFDAQAILFLDVKRAKILNNTIIGSGENFMWGGAGLATSGYVVGELEYTRNHMYHPLSWKEDDPSFGGFQWAEKNLFELKTSAKVLVFGNYFGGVTDAQGGYWPDAQSKAINIKLEQNSAGPTTCDRMEDLTFYKNFGKNLHAGVDVVGRTNSAQGCTNTPDRILWRDNLLELDAAAPWTPDPGAASGTWNATGWTLSGANNIQVIHNTTVNPNPTPGACGVGTVFSDGMLLMVNDAITPKWAGFVFKDNISDYRGCGVAGGGSNGTNATASLDGVYSGWVFTNNGILRAAGPGPGYPSGQVWATSWTSQVVGFNGGRDGNYRVASTSNWHNAASDGTDIGADVDGVEGATSHTPTGDWPLPSGATPTPSPSPSPAPTVSITGTVTLSGSGLPSVTVRLLRSTDRLKLSETLTAVDGSYALAATQGTSVIVVPVKAGYSFTPSEVLFSTINSNQVQNFTAAAPSPTPTLTPSPTATPPDSTAPVVTLTAPTAGATLSGTALVSVTATDNVGVDSTYLIIDDTVFASDSVAPYVFTLDTTRLADGSHTLYVRAWDASANAGDSHKITITVSNGGPSPTPTPEPSPTATPRPSPTPLPACTPNQIVGNPKVCRCTTRLIGNPKRCKP